MIGRGATASYALGSFGTGVFSTVPTVLLLFYCTETLALPAAWAAVIVFVPKVWAILWDPFVGTWSDRSRGRWGRRRPFIAGGTVGVMVSFIALFSTPVLSPAATLAWVGLSYFALATTYSIFAVPYIAVPAEIANTPLDRTRLVGWRMTCAMIGILAGAGLAPTLVTAAGGGRSGYATMALVLGVLCGVGMAAPLIMLRHFDGSGGRAPAAVGGDRRSIKLVLGDAPFRRLAAGYLLLVAAAGSLSAATPYLVTRSLGRADGDIGLVLSLLLTATIAVAPWCGRIGRHVGERNLIAVAGIAYALAAAGLGASVVIGGGWPLALAAFASAGVPFAVLQVLPFVLLANLAHQRSGGRSGVEATYAGIWTAIEKLGLAAGPALTGLALASSAADVRRGIALFMLIVPASLSIAGILVIGRSSGVEE